MLPLVVFVLSNALASEPNIEGLRVEWPPDVLRVFAEQFVTEVTEGLWGHHSFSTMEAIAMELRSTWAQLLLAERLREMQSDSRLEHPFEIGRGWTCGAPGSPSR